MTPSGPGITPNATVLDVAATAAAARKKRKRRPLRLFHMTDLLSLLV
jgi:hypothetical protein